MSHRVVSLLPSATEIVAALGSVDLLVGRSHECDYPPSVASLPACCAPKIDVGASSREIDEAVRSLAQEAVSVYRLDLEQLRELAPTLVVTQTQCDVCAVSFAEVERALGEMVRSQPTIVPLSPSRLTDVWADIRRVASGLGCPERGGELVAKLEARLSRLAARTAALGSRPRVLCLEWIEPAMASGNWVPELVRFAGGEPVLGHAGVLSGRVTAEAMAEADPGVVVVVPCGLDLERTRRELSSLVESEWWGGLRAVEEGRVALVDGHQYLNRPGPRLVESAEILAEILHPREVDLGHRAAGGWEPL